MENCSAKVKLHGAIASTISTCGQAVNNERAAFCNAVHRTCFYHLWTQKFPSLRGKAAQSIEADACWRTIDKWINSLSKDLETWDEFQLSRRLLESWLASKRLRKILDQQWFTGFLSFWHEAFSHTKRGLQRTYSNVYPPLTRGLHRPMKEKTG
jgi:hypothetical protein